MPISRISEDSNITNPLPFSQQINFIPVLPQDVINTIFGFLQGSEIATCNSVSKQWKQITNSEFIWKKALFRDFPQTRLNINNCFKKAYQHCYRYDTNFVNGVYALHSLKVSDVDEESGYQDPVKALNFTDEKLFSCTPNGEIKIWDLSCFGDAELEDFKLEKTARSINLKGFITNSFSFCNPVFFGETVVSGSHDGKIEIWNLKQKARIATLSEHTCGIKSLHFKNGKLVSDSYDRTIRIWDLNTLSCIEILENPSAESTVLLIYNQMLFIGTIEGMIEVWDSKAKIRNATLNGHQGGICTLQVVDEKLISGSNDRTMRIWDLKTMSCLVTLTGHQRPITHIMIMNRKLISRTTAFQEPIKIWDLCTNICIQTFSEIDKNIESFLFADGKLFLGTSGNGIAFLDFTASHEIIFKEIADLIEDPNMFAIAMLRFSRMPVKKRTAIYADLGKILNLKSPDSKDYAEDAFHNRNGLSSSPQQKAEAINNYLKRVRQRLVNEPV